MELQFYIRPGVSPLDRGDLEDLVVEALGSGAECLGGGGMLDGSESDFVIEVTDQHIEDVLAKCREVFAAVSFSQPTTVELDVDGEVYSLPTRAPSELDIN